MTSFFQNTYNYNMPRGAPGRIADCGFKDTLSAMCLENIPSAVGVYKPEGLDYKIALPRLNTSTNVFSADLVTGNEINATVNGVAITPVAFQVSHLATMNAIANEILQIPSVTSATVGGANNRTITIVTAPGVAASASFVVTLGASQATVVSTVGLSGAFFGVTQAIYGKMNLFIPDLGDGASVISGAPAPYYTGQVAPTLTQGRIYVIPETIVTSSSPVYLRTTANGVNTQIGSFRGDADGGNAVLVSSAYALWREGNQFEGDVAVLELNIP